MHYKWSQDLPTDDVLKNKFKVIGNEATRTSLTGVEYLRLATQSLVASGVRNPIFLGPTAFHGILPGATLQDMWFSAPVEEDSASEPDDTSEPDELAPAPTSRSPLHVALATPTPSRPSPSTPRARGSTGAPPPAVNERASMRSASQLPASSEHASRRNAPSAHESRRASAPCATC